MAPRRGVWAAVALVVGCCAAAAVLTVQSGLESASSILSVPRSPPHREPRELQEAANDGQDIEAKVQISNCDVACLRASLRSANLARHPLLQLAPTPAASAPAPAPPPAVAPAPATIAVTPGVTAELPTRFQGVEAIKQRKGTIFFTHIRRAGGTTLEDYILKPFVKATHRKAYLCKEGALARFYRMTPSQKASFVQPLKEAALVWRHCPFGLHTLVPESANYVYITVIRSPLVRMLSWFAYCDKYSPDKCHTGKDFANNPGGSRASKFYASRLRLYKNANKGVLSSVSKLETFHPNPLEYALDDNYQTRLLCGPLAHDHAVPIGAEELACALRNLDSKYAVVGVTERYEETACVLSHTLNIPLPQFKNDKATTGSKRNNLPPDFVRDWKHYAALDEVVYDFANARLDEDTIRVSACTKTQTPATVVASRLAGFKALM